MKNDASFFYVTDENKRMIKLSGLFGRINQFNIYFKIKNHLSFIFH